MQKVTFMANSRRLRTRPVLAHLRLSLVILRIRSHVPLPSHIRNSSLTILFFPSYTLASILYVRGSDLEPRQGTTRTYVVHHNCPATINIFIGGQLQGTLTREDLNIQVSKPGSGILTPTAVDIRVLARRVLLLLSRWSVNVPLCFLGFWTDNSAY
jgi:hypothetical protein